MNHANPEKEFKKLTKKIERELTKKYPNKDSRMIWKRHPEYDQWKQLHDELIADDKMDFVLDVLGL